jgi:MFS family permease
VFVALLGLGIIAPTLPIYATTLGATGVTLGLIVASFSISRGIVQPIVGGWSDRKGRKQFLVGGLGIYTCGGLALPFCSTVAHLMLVRSIQGVGSAMTIPIAMAYIGDKAPEGQEGRYMGWLNIAIFAGIGGGPLLGGVLRDLLGIQSGFYAMSLLSAIAMVLVLVFLSPSRAEEKAQLAARLSSTLRRILGDRKVLGILLSRLATMTVMVPTMGFLPLLMTQRMQATGVGIGIVMAVRTLVNATLQPLFGRLADRYRKIVLLTIGSSFMSAFVLLIPSALTIYHLVVFFALLGAAEAVVWAVLGAFAVEEGRSYGQGAMMGVFNMAMSIGILIGSITAGTSMEFLGLGFSFYGIGLLLTVCTVGASWLIVAGARHRAATSKPGFPSTG